MREPSLRRRRFSWALFDFANSAFSTLVVTFVYATYFTTRMAGDEAEGTRLWGNAVALSAALIALLSPPLGAIADAFAWKRRLMLGFVGLCSVCCIALYWPEPGDVIWALTLFVIANVAVELGVVFNNGFLPELAAPTEQGRLSARAWACGYLGGLLCLGVALVGFVMPEQPWFGLVKEGGQHVRATNVLVGLWVAVFSLPMALWLRERRAPARSDGPVAIARASFRRLGETFRHLRSYKNVFWLLAARTFYNDGLATVFAFGAIYASGTFGFTFQDVLIFGIALNVFSGLGALTSSFFEDRIGSRTTIAISLAALIASTSAAVFVESRAGFWACAVVLGLFIGPNQSASRAFMSRISPKEKANEFFGFFAFSGKATAFAGPLLCGQLTGAFDSQRVGMAIVPVLMILGLALLLWKTKPALEGASA